MLAFMAPGRAYASTIASNSRPPHGLLASAPVVVEVGQVQAHSLPVVGDEPVRPRQVVEVLIPELALRRGLQAALPDARIGRVEQRQGADAVGMTQGQRLGDRRADVVASD